MIFFTQELKQKYNRHYIQLPATTEHRHKMDKKKTHIIYYRHQMGKIIHIIYYRIDNQVEKMIKIMVKSITPC